MNHNTEDSTFEVAPPKMHQSGNPNIDSLTRRGFAVTVQHFRANQSDFEYRWEHVVAIENLGGHVPKKMDRAFSQDIISYAVKPDPRDYAPRGGETVVTATKDGKTYVGRALCSIFDNFSRRAGLRIACRRVLENVSKGVEGSIEGNEDLVPTFEPESVPVVLDFAPKI